MSQIMSLRLASLARADAPRRERRSPHRAHSQEFGRRGEVLGDRRGAIAGHSERGAFHGGVSR